jgi:hypothetical protein
MEFKDGVKEKSNNELLQMVYEFDAWSPEMLATVEEELSSRNILPVDILEKKKMLIEEERIELSKGK